MSNPLQQEILPIDSLLLRGDPAAPALLLKDGALSYAELDRRVGRLAAILTGHGVQPGDRVATWLGKSWLACIMPLAAVRAGLVHVPINPVLKHAQAAHILADSGAKLLITNMGRAASLEPGDLPSFCAILDDAPLGEKVIASGEMLRPAQADANDLAAILYTSGSTGKPKGVVLSHANLWLGARSVATYLGLAPDDRVLGVLPLSFDYGQNQLLSAWYAGASVAPLDYLTAKDVVRGVERWQITTLAGVPPLWVQLIESDWPAETAVRLRRLTNSGGALTKAMVRQLRDIFPQAQIFAMYGLTEAFRSTYLDPALIDSRPDSMGKEIPFAEVLVVRPDGTSTMDDEPGELVHCGPLVAQGYWKDPTRTAQRFKPAPTHARYQGMAVWSGDTVRRDADGYLYFVGRDDSMIKSAGNRISPTEVEEAAEATGLVADAVAVGVPDQRLGQAIFLVARSKGTDLGDVEDQLRAALRASLPNFMQPSYVLLRNAMPVNANGKIDRPAITKLALNEAADQQKVAAT